MSKKKPSVASLLTLIKKAGQAPEPLPRFKDLDAMEHGMVFVLSDILTARQAEASVRALRKAWEDWNEVRVCQIQDLAMSIKSKSADISREAARRVLDYLQDVFQHHHSFDLLDYEHDLAALGKHLTEFPVLGKPGAHYVQWVVGEEVMPVTGHLVRVFDRLGLMDRTTSYKKGLEVLSKLGGAKGKKALTFALAFGRVAGEWCDSRKPACHACPLVDACPYGEKAYKDWLAQQERLEIQRKREEERERKRLEVEARKAEREAERDRKARERELKRAKAKQAAADKKKAEEAAKKKAAKKVVKKTAKKKATKKVVKKAAKKKATKKVVKKAAKKKAAKKVVKKAAKKKAAKKVVKKAAKKKATKKVVKKAAKKKATKKKARKRS